MSRICITVRFKDYESLMISYLYFVQETDASTQKKKRVMENIDVLEDGFFNRYEIFGLM